MMALKYPIAATALLMLGCVAGDNLPEEAKVQDTKADTTEESCSLSDTESTIQGTLEGFGLTSTNVIFDELEVRGQANEFANAVWFDEALSLAMESFLFDDEDAESPRALLEYVDQDPQCDSSADQGDPLVARILCHINQAETAIGLVERVFDADADVRIFPPEQGEDLSQNWVFFMKIPSMGDHLHWALVSRQRNADDTVTVYNYGFN